MGLHLLLAACTRTTTVYNYQQGPASPGHLHCPLLRRLVSPQPRLVSSFELGLSGSAWSLATKWR